LEVMMLLICNTDVIDSICKLLWPRQAGWGRLVWL